MPVHPSLSLPGWPWLGCLLILCCLSCSSGSGLNPVQGKVLYKNQGIKGALVTFHLKGSDPITDVRPVGLTQEDGTFTLTTGSKEGAPAGEYVVTIIWPQTVGPPLREGEIAAKQPDTEDRLHGAYANAKTSVLKAVVKEGANQLDPFPLK